MDCWNIQEILDSDLNSSSRKNWKILQLNRFEIRTTNALSAKSQSEGTIQLVPEARKMAIIIARRWRGTWEGVPMATWCSEWICRVRGGLVHHIVIILLLAKLHRASLPQINARSCSYALPSLENNPPMRTCVLEQDPGTDTTEMDLLIHFSDCFYLFWPPMQDLLYFYHEQRVRLSIANRENGLINFFVWKNCSKVLLQILQ